MAESYYFGRFALDPAERRLWADGIPVPLGLTRLKLLLALVESDGVVLTKDQLISRVWGHSDIGDNALHVHIAALRKIVGDDCIATRQGLGYRFIEKVQKNQRDRGPRLNDQQRGNLPSLWTGNVADGPTRLIGRIEQLRSLSNLLAQGRLVTLTGPGGVGKTTLALQAATEASSHFCDGVWLVELATLNDPNLVPGAMASVLGVQIGTRATPLGALSRYLARKSVLIVLDNCEHVIAAAARISEALLSSAPGVKILATSREPLSCSGEQVMDVPPLAVPGEGAMPPNLMRNVAAVHLFMERAMEADVNFRIRDGELPIVARICRRVDGLPLAIEMVASWAGTLGLETLDAKLNGSLKAWLRARSTAPLRHSTLRATLEWSHGLLSAAEQAVLRRLAIFASSFSMEGAEVVAADDAIPKEQVFENVANLIRKSMIAVVPGSRAQGFRLLETTRAFMLEELTASGDADLTRQRHATHVLRVLERAMSEWENTSDAVWLERYSPMLDDVRGALDWAMGERSDDAVALAGASWPLWRELSLLAEGRQRLGAASGLLRPDTPLAPEARLRRGLGEMLLNTEAMKAAHNELERAVILYRKLDDRVNVGGALAHVGYLSLVFNRTQEAQQLIQEALSLLEPAGCLWTLAYAYAVQLCVEGALGSTDSARVAGEKAARLCELAGCDRTAFVVAANLVQFALESGDVDGAISAGRDVTVRLRDTRHSGIRGFALGVLAAAFATRADLGEALIAAREAAPLLRDEGALSWLFDHLALLAALGGRARDSALIAGYANVVYQIVGRTRDTMGIRAVERLDVLLHEALADDEIARLGEIGAGLSEDQALTLALSV